MAQGDLTLPASEQVVAASSTPVTEISYLDAAAFDSPGLLFLSVTADTGTLSASTSTGQAPGSGTASITLSAPYNDVASVLDSLVYSAGPAAGTDTIRFDIWDQFGIESSGSVPVSSSAATIGTADETWTGGVSSDWNTPGNWSGDAVPKRGDSLAIAGGTANAPVLANATLSGETITLSNNATLTLNSVRLDSLLQASGSDSLLIGGALTIAPHGSLGPEQSGTLFVNTAGTAVPIVNRGVIEAPQGSLFTINNGGTQTTAAVSIANRGTLTADGGRISFDFAPPPFGSAPPEQFVNAGSVAVGNGGSLTLNGTFSGNDVAFNGPGALGLQRPQSFAGSTGVSGFGQGDHIDLYGPARGALLGVTNSILSAGTATTIPLAGSYVLGNFISDTIGTPGGQEIIAFAPAGAPSGIAEPDIVAPGTATVAQGATLSLSDVSVTGLGRASNILSVTAGSGTLLMDGASGSGSHTVTVQSGTPDQIAADLATLAYVPAAGATSDVVRISAVPPAPVTTTRAIPLSITEGSGPVLSEPSSTIVSANGSIAVAGSYADSFAQGHPGLLFLGINDICGTLSATDATGNAVAGSGTDSIVVQTDYVDVNAILASLHYAAGPGGGTDTIAFDVWNQAGAESTASSAVTIDPPALPAIATTNLSSAAPATAGTIPTGPTLPTILLPTT